MVIDCHGHYTTVPREVQAFRDAQIAGLLRGEAAQLNEISDDRIRESVQPQLAFQAARGTNLTIFSPRASSMGHSRSQETGQDSLEYASRSPSIRLHSGTVGATCP